MNPTRLFCQRPTLQEAFRDIVPLVRSANLWDTFWLSPCGLLSRRSRPNTDSSRGPLCMTSQMNVASSGGGPFLQAKCLHSELDMRTLNEVEVAYYADLEPTAALGKF